MQFDQLIDELTDRMTQPSFVRAIISQPRSTTSGLNKIKVKPVMLKGETHLQFEYYYERILKHENKKKETVRSLLEQLLQQFKQIQLELQEEQIHVQITKKFKVSWKSKQQTIKKPVQLQHDRQKNYILQEGTVYPFLVRLGVQLSDGRIRKQKYDKFKQINRFIELIDDILPHLPSHRPLRIIDFGSGKSYLTFALYHYLAIEKKLEIEVIGLDLKKEVIATCNEIAQDLQYTQLQFIVGDITDYTDDHPIDLVVTLHACDVATDLALAHAVKWQTAVILSVPCCQHELFSQIQSPPLEILLQHGLLKERFAALATDALRAELLTLVGYDTQMLEFVDATHTPKNILIRAVRTKRKPSQEEVFRYQSFRDLLSARPFLENELQKARLLPFEH